jgi:MFS family permease
VTANPRLLVALGTLQSRCSRSRSSRCSGRIRSASSLADIFLLQAVFGLAVVLLQFPSGYVADRVGYRRSLLVGAALSSAGWLIYTGATSFAGVMVAEVLLGGGSAFISGADRALLWVSLEADGRQSQYTRWDGRVRAAAQVGEAGSAAIGGWLYSLAPRLPFWLRFRLPARGGIMGALREVPRRDGPRALPLAPRARLHIVRFTLWHHRRLQAAMTLSVALGLSTFVVIWLIQPAAQARGVPPAWFGPLWAGAHAWLALVSLASSSGGPRPRRARDAPRPAASSCRSATWALPRAPRPGGSASTSAS